MISSSKYPVHTFCKSSDFVFKHLYDREKYASTYIYELAVAFVMNRERQLVAPSKLHTRIAGAENTCCNVTWQTILQVQKRNAMTARVAGYKQLVKLINACANVRVNQMKTEKCTCGKNEHLVAVVNWSF